MHELRGLSKTVRIWMILFYMHAVCPETGLSVSFVSNAFSVPISLASFYIPAEIRIPLDSPDMKTTPILGLFFSHNELFLLC